MGGERKLTVQPQNNQRNNQVMVAIGGKSGIGRALAALFAEVRTIHGSLDVEVRFGRRRIPCSRNLTG